MYQLRAGAWCACLTGWLNIVIVLTVKTNSGLRICGGHAFMYQLRAGALRAGAWCACFTGWLNICHCLVCVLYEVGGILSCTSCVPVLGVLALRGG